MFQAEKRTQAAAEQEVARFASALGPFVVAAETTRMPMVFSNAREAGNPLIFANDSFLALCGYARDEVLGQPFDFLMVSPADPRARAEIAAGFSGEDDGSIRVECRRKDGGTFLAAIYTSPVRDRHGDIVQHFASFVDLTAQVERSRRDASALHTPYENAPGFIAITEGPDHVFGFANASYLQLVGHRNILGRKVADVMPELDEQGVIGWLDRVYATGEPYVGKNVPVRIQRKEGEDWELRCLDFVYQPVRDADQAITGIFCQGQDVTDHAVAEERVLVLQAELIHLCRVSAMSAMAMTLAHELNQPLTAISNYVAACRCILASGDGMETLDEALVAVGKSARRAGEIIRRLRDMTQGRTTPRERFDLNEAVAEALALVRAGASQGGQIVFIPGASVQVDADRVQIQQVVMNLARNACEAASSAEDARVTVSIAVNGGQAIVSVDDLGAGVTPKAAGMLFEWADSTKPDGMGFGLSISRTIIEAHHGRIWHDSEHEGGTRFSFSLPISGPLDSQHRFDDRLSKAEAA
jgi:two-component system sensor kinase FixL